MPKLIPDFAMWFDVPAEHAPGQVEIINLQGGDIQEISLEATDIRTRYQKDAAPVRETSHRLGKDANLTICRSIKSWQGFQDFDGKELPCTDANKLLYARQDWFRPFIAECRIEVKKAFEAQREATIKNSSALPSGSPA